MDKIIYFIFEQLFKGCLMIILCLVFAFLKLDRNILDQDSKIILGLVVKVKHSINIILVFPKVYEEYNGSPYHNNVQNIHDIVVITVICICKFYWWELNKKRISTFLWIDFAIIICKIDNMYWVKVWYHE
jgi:hypothetical protein